MVADHACHFNAHYYLQIIQALLFLDQWFPTGGKFSPGGKFWSSRRKFLSCWKYKYCSQYCSHYYSRLFVFLNNSWNHST